MPWRMITDQANAAAESNGRFFNKTNRRIDSNHESECSNTNMLQHNMNTSAVTHEKSPSFCGETSIVTCSLTV